MEIITKKKQFYKKNCIAHYEANVERYIKTYQDDYSGYPANKKRLEIMETLIQKHSPKKILYIGCGACIPMVKIMEKFDCIIHGIDFSQKMIDQGKHILIKNNFSDKLITKGDIEDINSLPEDTYEFAIAAGVFTHLLDDHIALQNIHSKLASGGILAAEYRNELFSLFSYNRFSYDFIVNKLIGLDKLPDRIKTKVEKNFKRINDISSDDKIVKNSTHISNGLIKKFHNPLTIQNDLKQNGFSLLNNFFYHYHALPTGFANIDIEVNNDLSIHLENPTHWTGLFMASAFISETEKVV